MVVAAFVKACEEEDDGTDTFSGVISDWSFTVPDPVLP